MSPISGTLPQPSLYPDKKATKPASTGKPAAQPAPTSGKLSAPTHDKVHFGQTGETQANQQQETFLEINGHKIKILSTPTQVDTSASVDPKKEAAKKRKQSPEYKSAQQFIKSQLKDSHAPKYEKSK